MVRDSKGTTVRSKQLTASAIAASVLTGAIAAATPPAHAATAGHVYTATAGSHARTTFKSSGSWFYVFDTRADGTSALGQIHYATKLRTISATGHGNSTGYQVNDIPNGARFTMRACYGNVVHHRWKVKHCGAWVSAVA